MFCVDASLHVIVLTLKPADLLLLESIENAGNEITRVDSCKCLSRPALAMYQSIQTFSTHEIKGHKVTYKAIKRFTF